MFVRGICESHYTTAQSDKPTNRNSLTKEVKMVLLECRVCQEVVIITHSIHLLVIG